MNSEDKKKWKELHEYVTKIQNGTLPLRIAVTDKYGHTTIKVVK